MTEESRNVELVSQHVHVDQEVWSPAVLIISALTGLQKREHVDVFKHYFDSEGVVVGEVDCVVSIFSGWC